MRLPQFGRPLQWTVIRGEKEPILAATLEEAKLRLTERLRLLRPRPGPRLERGRGLRRRLLTHPATTAVRAVTASVTSMLAQAGAVATTSAVRTLASTTAADARAAVATAAAGAGPTHPGGGRAKGRKGGSGSRANVDESHTY